jgi:hypothetical protein
VIFGLVYRQHPAIVVVVWVVRAGLVEEMQDPVADIGSEEVPKPVY